MEKKIICQICKREFNNISGLSRHIKPSHRISSKDYYDNYLKENGEGDCLNCGIPTSFRDIGKNGYRKYCSKKCDDEYSKKQTRHRREREIIDNEMVGCELCDGHFKNLQGVSSHIKQKHPIISTQDYYDSYILEDEAEKYCEICENANSFYTIIKGYHTYCSRRCASQGEDRKKAVSRGLKSLFNNTKEKEKILEKRRTTNLERYGHGMFLQSEQWEEECLEKYGVNHPKKTKESRERQSRKISNDIVSGKFNPRRNYKTGYFFSNKNQTKLYYRSSYELLAYQLLEQISNVKSYETEPFKIPYKDRNGINRHYVPDILITYFDGSKELIEIKPERRLQEEDNLFKAEIARQYCKDNGITFNIWTEKYLEL